MLSLLYMYTGDMSTYLCQIELKHWVHSTAFQLSLHIHFTKDAFLNRLALQFR